MSRLRFLAPLIAALLAAVSIPAVAAVSPLPGMPPILNPHNIYSAAGANQLNPVMKNDKPLVYVPNTLDGTVSVIGPVTRKVVTRWPIPGGGSPDMGNVNAAGTQLWLPGRYDNVVYVFDTRTGKLLHKIKVGRQPHGLAVWPQPGRYSLGHTGNMR